jgi:ribosomal protein S18 acetylase RimI-like enzyme
MTPSVIYAREETLDVLEFRRVLAESGLGTIRPLHDKSRLRSMIAGANLIVTARLLTDERPLIGLARCVTDFAWCCYLSELAVAESAQRLGVGRGLLEEIQRHLGPRVSIALVSVPDAIKFYEKAGMKKLANAFWHPRAH